MKHCKNCKYWYLHSKEALWGNCSRLVNNKEPCLIELVEHYCEQTTTVDTHPDFGCALWEE